MAISVTSAAWRVLGEPDAELEDILAEIETVQQAAFAKAQPRHDGRRHDFARRNHAKGHQECAAH